MCDGRPPMRPGSPEKVKYAISRRTGDAPLSSTFLALFEPYRVDEAMFDLATPDAIFLHCLPAHRGDELTDGVADPSHQWAATDRYLWCHPG